LEESTHGSQPRYRGPVESGRVSPLIATPSSVWRS
jgi:hypothetical protein